jgi:hypothetical protein
MTAAKAWTSLIITFLTPLLMTYGIGMDTTVEQLITIVVTAVIGAVATYFVPNKPVNEYHAPPCALDILDRSVPLCFAARSRRILGR